MCQLPNQGRHILFSAAHLSCRAAVWLSVTAIWHPGVGRRRSMAETGRERDREREALELWPTGFMLHVFPFSVLCSLLSVYRFRCFACVADAAAAAFGVHPLPKLKIEKLLIAICCHNRLTIQSSGWYAPWFWWPAHMTMWLYRTVAAVTRPVPLHALCAFRTSVRHLVLHVPPSPG